MVTDMTRSAFPLMRRRLEKKKEYSYHLSLEENKRMNDEFRALLDYFFNETLNYILWPTFILFLAVMLGMAEMERLRTEWERPAIEECSREAPCYVMSE